jgi:hypothetical protein
LEIEGYSRCRKYRKSAHMACLAHFISLPSSQFSSIWIPLINQQATNSYGRVVDAHFYGISLTSVSVVVLGLDMTLTILGHLVFGNSFSVLGSLLRIALSPFGVF